MPIFTFTPNTKIKSSEQNANNQNFADHSLWVVFQWIFGGSIVAQTSKDYKDIPDDVTWERVDISVDVAPTGQNIIVDIERSTDSGSTWVTIFTNTANRPQIAAGSRTGSTTTIDIPAGLANSHLWRAKVVQGGSTVLGSDLTVRLKGRYNLD